MNGEPLRKGCEVFVWGDKNVLELDRDDGCSVFRLNTTALHVFSEFHFDERNKPRNCSPTPCLAWGYDPGGRTQKAIDELLWHICPGRVHDSRGAVLCPGEVAAPSDRPAHHGACGVAEVSVCRAGSKRRPGPKRPASGRVRRPVPCQQVPWKERTQTPGDGVSALSSLPSVGTSPAYDHYKIE